MLHDERAVKSIFRNALCVICTGVPVVAAMITGCGRVAEGCERSPYRVSGCWGLASFADPARTCMSADCKWGLACAPRRCDSRNQRDCLTMAHCTWDEATQHCGIRSALLPSCGSDASTCEGGTACEYAVTCYGEWPDCNRYESPEQCGANPLCTWNKGTSRFQLGNREADKVSDRSICKWSDKPESDKSL
jgi:hypothetical protein